MSDMQLTEQKILECLARAYTYIQNEKKELDVTLINAMAEELMIMLDKELPKTVVLAYDNFPKGKTTISELLDELLKDKDRFIR